MAAEPQRLDPDDVTACTCFGLRRATRMVTQVYDAALRPSGLRATQFTVLGALVRGGPIALTQLAERLALDRTTLTRNLKPLEKAGLVTSAPGADRRERLLEATPEGRRRFAEASQRWRVVQSRVVEALGETSWAELLGRLRGVEDALRTRAP